MKVRHKKTAIEDIQATEEYIRGVLHNSTAARRLTGRIKQAMSLLSENPCMGTPLNSRFDVESDLRYLLVSDQLIFYRVVEGSHENKGSTGIGRSFGILPRREHLNVAPYT